MEEERSLDMDAVTAHLDRGWALLNRGDYAGARVSARHILELDGESPEGHTLMGAIVAAEGDPEEALDLFRRALDADPEYVDAMLYAAELAIPLGDIDYALQLCEEAGELATDEELIDIWLLKAEASAATGEEARMEQAPPPPYPDPAYYLRIGRLCLDLGRREQALELLREALEHEPSRLDAQYFLGVTLELEGRPREAMEHLLAVYEADRREPDPPWSRRGDEFDAAVGQVLAQLPGELGEKVRAAPTKVLEYPALELVVEGFDPRAPIFFAGVPADAPDVRPSDAKRHRRGGAAEPQLVAVFIYKRNVERFAGSREGVLEELNEGLLQEAAFFFGVEDPTDPFSSDSEPSARVLN